MRRLVGALIVLAAIGATALAEPPSPGSFTIQFARALQAAMPSASITIVRALELLVKRANGASATLYLGNAYKGHAANPASFDQMVKTYAVALAKPSPMNGKVDRTRIVPLIKDRAWLAQLQAMFSKKDASQHPVFDDFNRELVVVYAEDTEKSTRYLSAREHLGVERSKLRALAVGNLLRVLPSIEMRMSKDGVAMITSHDDYGASVLLVDNVWSGGQLKVDGEIVVAVPAKDVVFATGSRNLHGLKALREVARRIVKGRYGLIDTLFVYRDGRFVKFSGT